MTGRADGRAPGSLGGDLALAIVTNVLVRVPQLIFGGAALTFVVVLLGMLAGGQALAAATVALGAVGVSLMLFAMVSMMEIPAWVHRTRYRLRRAEEAEAQQTGRDVPMRSRTLRLKMRGRTVDYEWVGPAPTLTSAEARALPPRRVPRAPVDIRPPWIIRVVDDHPFAIWGVGIGATLLWIGGLLLGSSLRG